MDLAIITSKAIILSSTSDFCPLVCCAYLAYCGLYIYIYIDCMFLHMPPAFGIDNLRIIEKNDRREGWEFFLRNYNGLNAALAG